MNFKRDARGVNLLSRSPSKIVRRRERGHVKMFWYQHSMCSPTRVWQPNVDKHRYKPLYWEFWFRKLKKIFRSIIIIRCVDMRIVSQEPLTKFSQKFRKKWDLVFTFFTDWRLTIDLYDIKNSIFYFWVTQKCWC